MVLLPFNWNGYNRAFAYGGGNITVATLLNPVPEPFAGLFGQFDWRYCVGSCHANWAAGDLHVMLPQLCLITAVTPLAVGPFLSYRFRLWHYLAYTALVALELAYYLRWQE
jgi:hypothetical protein